MYATTEAQARQSAKALMDSVAVAGLPIPRLARDKAGGLQALIQAYGPAELVNNITRVGGLTLGLSSYQSKPAEWVRHLFEPRGKRQAPGELYNNPDALHAVCMFLVCGPSQAGAQLAKRGLAEPLRVDRVKIQEWETRHAQLSQDALERYALARGYAKAEFLPTLNAITATLDIPDIPAVPGSRLKVKELQAAQNMQALYAAILISRLAVSSKASEAYVKMAAGNAQVAADAAIGDPATPAVAPASPAARGWQRDGRYSTVITGTTAPAAAGGIA